MKKGGFIAANRRNPPLVALNQLPYPCCPRLKSLDEESHILNKKAIAVLLAYTHKKMGAPSLNGPPTDSNVMNY